MSPNQMKQLRTQDACTQCAKRAKAEEDGWASGSHSYAALENAWGCDNCLMLLGIRFQVIYENQERREV